MKKFIIVKEDINKFALKFYVDGTEHFNNTLDNIARNHLFMNTTKVFNTLRKEYNMIIDRKKKYSYEFISTYGENYDDAQKACDWLNSILLSNEMKGVDNLIKEKKEKREASYNKRVNKKFNEVIKYKDKIGTFQINMQADFIVSTKLEMVGSISNVSTSKGSIILDTTIGRIEATFMSFQFEPNTLTIINAGQKIVFNID